MTSLPTDSVEPASVPHITRQHLERGYGSQTSTRPAFSTQVSAVTDFAASQPNPSILSQTASQSNGRFNEEWDASQRGSSIIDGPTMQRSDSVMSQGETLIPQRGGTLKKKASLKRTGSLKRSSSRRSSRAGSVRSMALEPQEDQMHSAFYSPVPISGNPTELLAARFTTWRRVLKDLITYFREIQTSYDHRAKSLLKVSNVINNTEPPTSFLQSGGIDDAIQILRNHHKQSIAEANKSKAIEEDVILALTGLRSDLQQKIKEIKNLSGDFKNSVSREMEGTRKVVAQLKEALGQSDLDTAANVGRQDPYLLRLAADRQLEKQIDEENYLHQAYLNLETSGRELEAIVVGEIQKSYNAYAGILKREADGDYETIENLRSGPIAMPKDHEWNSFIAKDPEHFIDPNIPIRQSQNLFYPGRDHELATEVRAGLLERKSKYLKSYTAGWYVLSPTHLHEFKSADKTQAPIMSLYLPEQKLGSHSTEGGSSNKFMLKGRQTGSMHRGHSWVFRAESHDTMMAWYEDIQVLTEKTPQERSAFVRQHARSVSGNSQKPPSISSDGVMDEEDEEPFSAATSAIVMQPPNQDSMQQRPEPGGRFPSDLQVNAERGLQVPLSPSSAGSGFGEDHDVNAAAAALPGSGVGNHYPENPQSGYGIESHPTALEPSHASELNHYAQEDGHNPYTYQPVEKRDTFGNAPMTVAGAALGAAAVEAYREHQASNAPEVVPNHDNEGLAAQEASMIAAPDTDEPSTLERIAMQESALIASPDLVNGDTKTGLNQQNGVASGPVVLTSTTAKAAQPQTDNIPNPFDTVSKPPAEAETSNFQRPSLSETIRAGIHHSTQSVSQLHVPGEFPLASPAEEKPAAVV